MAPLVKINMILRLGEDSKWRVCSYGKCVAHFLTQCEPAAAPTPKNGQVITGHKWKCFRGEQRHHLFPDHQNRGATWLQHVSSGHHISRILIALLGAVCPALPRNVVIIPRSRPLGPVGVTFGVYATPVCMFRNIASLLGGKKREPANKATS